MQRIMQQQSQRDLLTPHMPHPPLPPHEPLLLLLLLLLLLRRQVKYGGISNLWRDLMQRHTQARYHLQVGGGDQIYADRLFHAPSLQPWLKIDNHEVS